MLNVLYIWLNVHVPMHCSYFMNNVRGADKKRRRQKHRHKDVDQLSKRSFQLYHDCSSPFSLITHLLMSKPCYREWQNTFNLLRPRLVPPITLCTFFGSWSENGHPWFDLAIFIVHHRRKKKRVNVDPVPILVFHLTSYGWTDFFYVQIPMITF